MSNPHEPGQYGSPQGGPPFQPPTEPHGWQPQFPIDPRPKSGNKVALIVGVVAAALVLGVGAYFLLPKKDADQAAAPPATTSAEPTSAAPTTTKPKKGGAASSASVGDCIKVKNDSATEASVEKIDCGRPDAVFKVAKKLDTDTATCPADSDYLEYEETGRLSDGFSLCLMVNAEEGECFTDLGQAAAARKVDCADPLVRFEVLEVIEGKNTPEDCVAPEVDDGFVYEEPKLVICGKSRK